MNSPSYRRQKLNSAAETLMTHPGTLRERVEEAGKYWAFIYDYEEFEPEAGQIRSALASVREGDYSRITDAELQGLAHTLYDLVMRVCESDAANK